MEFSKLESFLISTAKLETFGYLITGEIGNEDVLDYWVLGSEVIAEVNKNLSTVTHHSVPLNFNQLFKKFIDYSANVNYK